MSDIRTAFISFAGDLVIAGPSLDDDDGLETAVVISLFTDRRAQPGDALPQFAHVGGLPDRRGWWGDSFAEVPGDRIGSRRWLLYREKLTPATVARLIEYDREALQWLIDDGIARAVNISAEIQGIERIAELIEIVRSDKPVAQYRFNSFWKAV